VLADFLTDDFRRHVDYSEYGGAPLLGLAGVAIVGHGRSSAKAVRNGIAMAFRFAQERVLDRLQLDIAAAAVPVQ
jgi:phosphate acyltransferase